MMLKITPRTLFNLALDFIYPKRCVGCQKPDTYLCALCQRQIEFCENDTGEKQFFVFRYGDHRIKRLIWLLKYRNIKEISELFGKLLYELTIEELAEEMIFTPANGKIAVIPVPLSPRRRRFRGYNQSEEIAKTFVAHDPKNFCLEPEILIKTRETPTQVSLADRTERLANLKNAFELKSKRRLKNNVVILLDDVSTTGATLAECEKILKKAGVRKVIKVAIAHG